MINSVSAPLLVLGAIILFQLFGGLGLSAAVFLIVIAYVQNVSYSLQSRAAVRNSNVYHILGAVLSSSVFFATRRYLITKDMPFLLLPAYVFGTVFGSLNGNVVSKRIEKFIDATTAPSSKNANQLVQFWPSVTTLLVALWAEIIFLPNPARLLPTVAGLSFLSNFAFSVVRVTRNGDNHWVHLGAILFEATMSFILLKILIVEQMNWILFIPQLTGGVIASLSGAEFTKLMSKKIKAKTDAHVKEGKEIKAPVLPIVVAASLMILQFIFFGFGNLQTAGVLVGAVLAQSISFSMVSRARQRNKPAYLVYCSLLSNGIWYATMHLYAADRMPNYLFIPNTSATAVGAMIGQDVSMRIEKKIDAVMDEIPYTKPERQTAQS